MSENLKKIMVSSAALLMFASVGTAAVNSSAMNLGTNVNASRVHHHAKNHVTSRWNRSHAFKYVLNGKRAVNTLPTPLRGERTVYTRKNAKGLRVRAIKGEAINHNLHYWQVSNKSGNVLGWVEANGVSHYHAPAKHISNNTKVVEASLAKVDFLAHDSVTNNNNSEMKNARVLLDKVDKLANTRAEKNEVKAMRNNVRKVSSNAKQERKNARENALNSVPKLMAQVRVDIDSANNVNNRYDAENFLNKANNALNKAQKAVSNNSKSDLVRLFNKNISAYSTAVAKARLNIDAKSNKKAHIENQKKQAINTASINATKTDSALAQKAYNDANNLYQKMNGDSSKGSMNMSSTDFFKYSTEMSIAEYYNNMAKTASKFAQSKPAQQQAQKQINKNVKATVINPKNL